VDVQQNIGEPCSPNDLRLIESMAAASRKKGRRSTETLMLHSIISVRQCDSVNKMTFHMKDPDSFAFSSPYQYLEFSPATDSHRNSLAYWARRWKGGDKTKSD
jgi:hypothetical protein